MDIAEIWWQSNKLFTNYDADDFCLSHWNISYISSFLIKQCKIGNADNNDDDNDDDDDDDDDADDGDDDDENDADDDIYSTTKDRRLSRQRHSADKELSMVRWSIISWTVVPIQKQGGWATDAIH